MDLSPNQREQRSSILLKGFGGALTQWDDLKTWQLRQEALFVQSPPAKNPGPDPNEEKTSTFGANLISLLMQTRNFNLEENVIGNEKSEEDEGSQLKTKHPQPANVNGPHHDLSMIPEVDEDTRTTVDIESSEDETTPTPSPKVGMIPKLPLSIPPLKIVPSNQTKPVIQHPPPNKSENRLPQLNPKPSENKPPNQNKRPTKPFLRKGQGLIRFNLRPEEVLKPYQNEKKNPTRVTKPPPKPVRPFPALKQPDDCPIALSSLKLKKDPPKSSQPNFGAQRPNAGLSTWSHFLAQDPDDENLNKDDQDAVAGLVGVRRMQENVPRQNWFGSPKRTGTLRLGARSTQEDDEESLAAYIALEQQVGNTSFCSTSSSVDRLIAKSSRFHRSESPPRNRLPSQKADEQKRPSEAVEPPMKTAAPCFTNQQRIHENEDESVSSDWEAEEEELKRKKMSQFSAGGVNVIQVHDDESFSESDPESETDSDSSEDQTFSTRRINPVKAADLVPSNNPCDTSTASIDLVIENINRKVEDQFAQLCVEIETLQKSNVSAKKQVKSMKKQVRKLEQRLATEHMAYERKLAEEREAAAIALAEEKAKVAKEKANFERYCREQKKKEPSPVLLEQVERLKSDMVAKEEKWRAEKARSRGIECNLRIQITNLRQENEKLKAENSKLKREKETAMNAAKAKNVSNTKVINAIAQHLSKAKPQVTVTREVEAPSGKVIPDQPNNKASKPTSAQVKVPTTKKIEGPNKPQPTIGVFPTNGAPLSKDDEWSSSDEEVDLGPETPEKLEEKLTKAMSNGVSGLLEPCRLEDCRTDTVKPLTDSVIAETEARYNELFKNDGGDNLTTKKTNGSAQSGNNVIMHPDGSVERKKNNGGSVLTLPDGTQKRQGKNGSVMTVPPSGWPILVTYYNGDKLERHEDGTVCYFYAKTQTWQITYPDGREELRLPNGVVGDKKGDGSLTVKIPTETVGDPTVRRGTYEEINTGETIVILPNGDQEIRTKDYVERRFQDGTVRFLYNDGMQKTIYTSGRIRVKDANGKLLMDTAINEKR